MGFVVHEYDSTVSTKKLTSLEGTPMETILPYPVTATAAKSVSSKRSRPVKKTTRFGTHGVLGSLWSNVKRRFGTVSSPSLSSSERRASSVGQSVLTAGADEGTGDPDRVDRIVVDRVWNCSSHSPNSVNDDGDDHSPRTKSSLPAVPPMPFQEGWQPQGKFLGSFPTILWSILRLVLHFFSPKFPDEKAERNYGREDWSYSKPLARWSAVWLILNWILGCAFTSTPRVTFDDIFLYGVGPIFSVPVIFLVAFDWPQKHPVVYQTYICFSLWMWAVYYILTVWLCGYYDPLNSHFSCGTKDFIGMFYYTTALQVIGMFGLRAQRLCTTIGALFFFILACVTVAPLRPRFVRALINFLVFSIFLVYAHYMKEMADRRLFTLRNQLKIQFKATQAAQINERKAWDSKRRLTSYVFHDKFSSLLSRYGTLLNISAQVRVPLNAALLAVQNLNSAGIVTGDHEFELHALNDNLNMMRNVLNDVLDFNRMDSGTFEVSRRPFAFHTAIRSLFLPMQLATNERGQQFVHELDPNIDKVARRAAYQAMGESPEIVRAHMKQSPDVAGVLVGDQVRLRQVITNLASNATKFTPPGGTIRINTKLVHPTPEEVAAMEGPLTPVSELESAPKLSGIGNGDPLSASHLSQHNLAYGEDPLCELKHIVVRVEVTDTGCGISKRDMEEAHLFSAFNQTEQGKQQGGKGTGLGLALVRQIIKLSGGRLGVRSKAGEGSCFWVEVPLGVGREALIPLDMESDHSSTDPDLIKVRNAAMTNTVVSVTNKSLVAAVDCAAAKASKIAPPLERSSTAMHNIMEQGGKVELRIAQTSSETLTQNLNHVPPDHTGADDTSSAHELKPLSSSLFEGSVLSAEQVSLTDTTPEPAPPRDTGFQRPTYLPMPSRSIPGTVAKSTLAASTSSSPLSQFDTQFQGIPTPSSNSALPFDPGLTVLVVDDDFVTRSLMKRLLLRMGCTVELAENGYAALLAIGAVSTPASEGSTTSSNTLGPILGRPVSDSTEDKFHIIFLDNQMPLVSGITAVAKLREWGRRDFVVGVTGNALLSDQEEYLAAGVDHVLTKPIDQSDVRKMLELADRRRKSQLETPPPT